MNKAYIKKENESHSDPFIDWVKQCDLPPMTNTQAKFAEFLFEIFLTDKEKAKQIIKIGDLNVIFKSVRKYIKDNYNEYFEEDEK